MFNKKKAMFGFLFFFFLIVISSVSAVKPITSIDTAEKGLIIVATDESYLRTGHNHTFLIMVFNASNGHPVNSSITCSFHLHGYGGDQLFIGYDTTVEELFHYSWDLNGGNFTERTEYQAQFVCWDDLVGGETSYFFMVDDYGEKLTIAHSIKFNFAMSFLMILFLSALIGLVKTENYIGKFALYWICHLLFIAGTFSVWQFNLGYTTTFIGMAGIWKVLFYVSITSVVPMLFLSIAWIVYIHAYNEHFQKLIDKGEDTEKAFAMTNKKKGGWFNGM